MIRPPLNFSYLCRSLRYTSLCALLLVAALPADADTHDAQFTDAERNAIEEIIRNYIMRSPETILRSVQEHQARLEAEAEQKIVDVIQDRRDELLNDPNSYVAGNPEGDVTVVEFFDYRCGYCKRVHPVVKKLVEDDGNIRLVYKEFPILGPASVFAARAAVASLSSDKYLAFHNSLMEVRGDLTEDRVLFIAAEVGLDVDRLEAEIEQTQARAREIIDKNFELAEALRISGTPAFVIGDTVIRGAADLSTLIEVVAEVRQRRKADDG